MGGVRSFYTDRAEPAKPDNSLDKHAYYVRFSGSDEWLDSVSVEECCEGVVTEPVSVAAMHGWISKAKEKDPAVFIAGLV